MRKTPVLYIVIPCYNEELVLPKTAPVFLKKIMELVEIGSIDNGSKVLFVNDGSKDNTWNIIKELSIREEHYEGLCLSRNMGHQNALLAGLMTAKERADITISIDCDGQDDIGVMDDMVKEYLNGVDVVYGVRSRRETDTFFKRFTAEGFYKIMNIMGANLVFNHADYRLLSKNALNGLAEFKEVNLFLRGIVPMIGFRSSSVYYERAERIDGETHYPLKKMMGFAFDGITSFSNKPIRMITVMGFLTCFISIIAIIATIIQKIAGYTVTGWSSMICVILLFGGIQLLSLGVVGEYIGKIYMETKHRPRYIISEDTENEK